MQTFSWQRAVIKVGSALIAPDGNACSAQYLLAIAGFITASRKAGKEVILVSSGSVAAGRRSVPVTHQATIAEKQAMASIGQMQMMANWQRFFDFPCAQVLLTADDLRDRTRYVNTRNTLRELLRHQALPVVNENDTVAVNELKVGDNDNLAAFTALVAQADTLIICSDIDGLYSADPRRDATATLIPHVSEITAATMALAGGAGTALGTGGMRTKLEAASVCAKSGIQTLIVNGRDAATFDALSQGRIPGTHFTPQQSASKARALWLTHTIKTRGILHIDEGARDAVVSRGASLLPIGVLSVSGHFKNGDAVDLKCNDTVIAKGLALYDHYELHKIKGLRSVAIRDVLGYDNSDVVVHRDDMVLIT
ncbi:glutamate 5-kinase [Alteromonas halophila]|uniref:Glutamate 5-kinase n=1 Tax=Alteromonas halophila TaxID=516698 RepID=A0A918N0Y8_9ALTE|nr:glutamate 5-kinase [Alteromonas halophila]GGW91395.1 glutamate 5-kinase [Alteromonas halophila]